MLIVIIILHLSVPLPLHAQKLAHSGLSPEIVNLRASAALDLRFRHEVASLENFTELSYASALVQEHWESHFQNLFHHAYISEDIIQVLHDRVRQLLVPGLDIVEWLDFSSMICLKIKLVMIPLASCRCQSLSAICRLLHFFALAIEIRKLGEILGVSETYWHLVLLVRFIATIESVFCVRVFRPNFRT